jgi:hypothetical protein
VARRNAGTMTVVQRYRYGTGRPRKPHNLPLISLVESGYVFQLSYDLHRTDSTLHITCRKAHILVDVSEKPPTFTIIIIMVYDDVTFQGKKNII